MCPYERNNKTLAPEAASVIAAITHESMLCQHDPEDWRLGCFVFISEMIHATRLITDGEGGTGRGRERLGERERERECFL